MNMCVRHILKAFGYLSLCTNSLCSTSTVVQSPTTDIGYSQPNCGLITASATIALHAIKERKHGLQMVYVKPRVPKRYVSPRLYSGDDPCLEPTDTNKLGQKFQPICIIYQGQRSLAVMRFWRHSEHRQRSGILTHRVTGIKLNVS